MQMKFNTYIRNRIVHSVGSQYGVTACTISKCGIKDAVLQSFCSMIQLWLSSHLTQFIVFLICLFSTVFSVTLNNASDYRANGLTD